MSPSRKAEAPTRQEVHNMHNSCEPDITRHGSRMNPFCPFSRFELANCPSHSQGFMDHHGSPACPPKLHYHAPSMQCLSGALARIAGDTGHKDHILHVGSRDRGVPAVRFCFSGPPDFHFGLGPAALLVQARSSPASRSISKRYSS